MISSVFVDNSWDLGLRRGLRDSEMGMVDDLITQLGEVFLDQSCRDSRIWKPSPSGFFNCSSFYNILLQTSNLVGNFPSKEVWGSPVPPKIQAFCWEVVLQKINTLDLLQKKRPNMCLSPHVCCLCLGSGETISHLLISCPFVFFIWSWFSSLFGYRWTPSSSVVNLFDPTFYRQPTVRGRIMWRATRAAVLWSVWEERNNRIFKGRCRSKEEVVEGITTKVIHWLKSCDLFKDFSVEDIYRSWGIVASTTTSKAMIQEVWSPPAQQRVKLNFDGSSIGNPGPSGIGGVFRDNEGKIMALFSGPIGVGDSLRAEILALHQGVKLAKQLGLQQIEIEGDSKLVIGWMQSGQLGIWQYRQLIREILSITREVGVWFKWVRRSANGFADTLAKQGIARESFLGSAVMFDVYWINLF